MFGDLILIFSPYLSVSVLIGGMVNCFLQPEACTELQTEDLSGIKKKKKKKEWTWKLKCEHHDSLTDWASDFLSVMAPEMYVKFLNSNDWQQCSSSDSKLPSLLNLVRS